jgi:hypothetical protein
MIIVTLHFLFFFLETIDVILLVVILAYITSAGMSFLWHVHHDVFHGKTVTF